MKRRGAKTDPYGTPFLRSRNLLLLPFPVVRVKLRLPIISKIMRTMCLSGSNRSSLQVRPRRHTVLEAAVSLTNTAPDFFLAEKLSSMSHVSRVTWSSVDLPCRKPTCSQGSSRSMIGSKRAQMSLSRILNGTHSRDMGDSSLGPPMTFLV